MTLSLCLLTYNEIDGCRIDVPQLPLHQFDQVYAVDGGSTDGTIAYLESHGIAVHLQPKPGYNQAYVCAFEHCTKDALIVFHPKGSIDPGAVAKFRPLFERGFDLVVASRMIRGGRNEEDGKVLRPRKWFVLGLGLLAGLIWRRKGPLMWDVLHGFRGMRRDRFAAIEPLQCGLSMELEMVVRCYRKEYKAIEFPAVERFRPNAKTHFKAIPTGIQLLRYLVFELTRSA